MILQTIVIKTVWNQHKNRQWNTIRRPEINPCIYTELIFHKEARIVNVEKVISSINGAGNLISHAKE